MVRDDDLHHRIGERIEARDDGCDLLLVDAPALEGERTRRVDADDGDLGVDERRLEIALHDALELAERAEEPFPDAIERHVVVAGNDDLRLRQAGEKGARGLELGRARALGEITGDDDDVGRDRRDRRDQRLDDRRAGAAEVKIGEMNEGAHRDRAQERAAAAPSPPTTCSAAGRMR